jgi:hypothetical protein
VTPIGPIGLSQKAGNLQLCVPWFVGKNGARAGTKQDFLGVLPRVFGQRKTARWSLYPDIDWYFEIIGCGDELLSNASRELFIRINDNFEIAARCGC